MYLTSFAYIQRMAYIKAWLRVLLRVSFVSIKIYSNVCLCDYLCWVSIRSSWSSVGLRISSVISNATLCISPFNFSLKYIYFLSNEVEEILCLESTTSILNSK